MSYTQIANSEIDLNSPLTDALFTKIRDNIEAGGPDYTAGDYLLFSNDAERNTISTSYVKLKEIKVFRAGAYRIKFEMYGYSPITGVYARIYKNGAAVGTERLEESGAYVEYSEDIAGFAKGDVIQIYAKKIGTGYTYIKNFRIYCNEEGALIGY